MEGWSRLDRPVRAEAAERALAGRRLDAETAREAAALAGADIEPTGTIHAGSDYRRALIQELVRRALLRAAARAE